MDVLTRIPFDPFVGQWFVLTDVGIVISGDEYNFGDTVPEFASLFHISSHFDNGVIGTKEELESLGGKPVELSHEDIIAPVATFTSHPVHFEKKKEDLKEAGGDIFSMVNAGLLKRKDDLIAYANLFGIKLKASSSISIVMMLDKLEFEARKKGLITTKE